jgi:hypothetical protein
LARFDGIPEMQQLLGRRQFAANKELGLPAARGEVL